MKLEKVLIEKEHYYCDKCGKQVENIWALHDVSPWTCAIDIGFSGDVCDSCSSEMSLEYESKGQRPQGMKYKTYIRLKKRGCNRVIIEAMWKEFKSNERPRDHYYLMKGETGQGFDAWKYERHIRNPILEMKCCPECGGKKKKRRMIAGNPYMSLSAGDLCGHEFHGKLPGYNCF